MTLHDGGNETDETRLITHIPLNQSVIDFLYRCRDRTTNPYKKRAYSRAIGEVYSYWAQIDCDEWVPHRIGPSIARKIREFLEGFPEEDILNS